jgi:hypothetical protein
MQEMTVFGSHFGANQQTAGAERAVYAAAAFLGPLSYQDTNLFH